MIIDFSSETMSARREGNNIFKVLKENKKLSRYIKKVLILFFIIMHYLI